jgi:hypothetical protein
MPLRRARVARRGDLEAAYDAALAQAEEVTAD